MRALFVAFIFLAGCGASALRQHVIAATVATVVLSSSGDAIEQATASAIAACPPPSEPERNTCLDEIERKASAAATAFDAVRVLVAGYRDAVDVAIDSDSVVSALVAIAVRIARLWPEVVQAARELGIDLPSLSFPMGSP